jgi:hypothetical protein
VPKKLINLKDNDCRYIVDDEQKHYCAEPVFPGESWCEAHCHIVFQAFNPRRPRRKQTIVLPVNHVPVKEVEEPNYIPDLVEAMSGVTSGGNGAANHNAPKRGAEEALRMELQQAQEFRGMPQAPFQHRHPEAVQGRNRSAEVGQ